MAFALALQRWTSFLIFPSIVVRSPIFNLASTCLTLRSSMTSLAVEALALARNFGPPLLNEHFFWPPCTFRPPFSSFFSSTSTIFTKEIGLTSVGFFRYSSIVVWHLGGRGSVFLFGNPSFPRVIRSWGHDKHFYGTRVPISLSNGLQLTLLEQVGHKKLPT